MARPLSARRAAVITFARARGRVLQVVSVSLGSASRDTDQVVTLLDREVRVRRVGVGGDLKRARELISELDGQVDAFGLGGIDLYVSVRGRRYYFRDAVNLARAAKRTPVVCGAGLKDSLERLTVRALEERLDLQRRDVLMVSAVDRFGMAEELHARARSVLFGDLIFALGLPIPVRSIGALERLAHTLMPVISKVPFKWLYPVGEAQEKAPVPEKFARYYREVDILAGDWHYIRRYAPRDLAGKVLLTNTTTAADLEFMRQRGVSLLITTTPRFNGRSLGTNLLEAALVATEGASGELSSGRYVELIEQAGIVPTVADLRPDSGGSVPDAKIVPT